MILCQGTVKSKNLKRKVVSNTVVAEECLLCSNYITNSQSKLTCLNANCDLLAHITCLADIFLSPGEYVPIVGNCPFCNTKLKWGDLIRKMKGCSQNGEECTQEEESEEEEEEGPCVESQKKKIDDLPSWFQDCNDDL